MIIKSTALACIITSVFLFNTGACFAKQQLSNIGELAVYVNDWKGLITLNGHTVKCFQGPVKLDMQLFVSCYRNLLPHTYIKTGNHTVKCLINEKGRLKLYVDSDAQ